MSRNAPPLGTPRVGATFTPQPDGERGVAESLAHLCRVLGWADADRGALGGVVPPGARVVVKPNLVLHANQGPWGIEPLVTDPALVRAVTHEVLRAGASSVVVGDAPIQGCNFDELMDRTGLGNWAKTLAQDEPRFVGVRDFRRTVGTFENGLRVAVENLQPVENFVQFDLGRESLLEPVTDDRGMGRFRVTCYDPRLLRQTHARGVHRYLVAKELMDADLVINLPKLKTHKKAGITCCLKNLVGINGNKEYLPHHRVGSAAQGGDCYERSSVIRRSIEYLLDRQNMTSSPSTARALHQLTRQLHRLARLTGQSADTEGSWSGNDTVWRMCLDLNRILLYGSTDASIGADVQRRVLHIVDAVVAGHGNGPLSPEPLGLGLLLGGDSAPAIDWVAATLLAYDPSRIALTRQAFADDPRPLASFGANEVELVGDLGTGPASSVLAARDDLPAVKHPEGWRDASTAGLAREARSTLEVIPE